MEAIQGLIAKAAATNSKKIFKKCPPIDSNFDSVIKSPRSITPNATTKIVISDYEGGEQKNKCYGEFLSP